VVEVLGMSRISDLIDDETYTALRRASMGLDPLPPDPHDIGTCQSCGHYQYLTPASAPCERCGGYVG
jgi:hypothetical protein